MSEGNFTIVNNTAKSDGNLLWDIIIACNLFISQKSYNNKPLQAWLRLNAFLVLACLPAFWPACSLASAPLLELLHLSSST